MAQDYYTLLTPAGLEAVTYAIATETAVDFAFIAVGDAKGTTYFPTGQERTLKNEVWRGPITNYAVKPENPSWLELEASIPGNIGGFSIKEAGIFDSNNVLIAIAKPPEAYKPLFNQGATMDLRVKMTIEVSNADRVIINIDPSVVYVTKEYVDLQIGPHIPDPVAHIRFGTATGANIKIMSISPAPTTLVDGLAVSFKNPEENTGAVTLKVNNLAARPIVKANGLPVAPGGLKENGIYTVRYNATTQNFILQGEGGEYGNATVHDVLAGKTFGTEDGIKIGELIRGKKWASGSKPITHTGGNSLNQEIDISLDFTPKFIIVHDSGANYFDFSQGSIRLNKPSWIMFNGIDQSLTIGQTSAETYIYSKISVVGNLIKVSLTGGGHIMNSFNSNLHWFASE